MFEVLLTYPLRECWEEFDAELFQIAGRRSDFSGTTQRHREHGWLVGEFQDAYQMRKRLEVMSGVDETLAGLNVVLREYTSHAL